MASETIMDRIAAWFAYLPLRLAYRIVWLCARLNIGSGRDVYRAMWDANLALPQLNQRGPHDQG